MNYKYDSAALHYIQSYNLADSTSPFNPLSRLVSISTASGHSAEIAELLSIKKKPAFIDAPFIYCDWYLSQGRYADAYSLLDSMSSFTNYTPLRKIEAMYGMGRFEEGLNYLESHIKNGSLSGNETTIKAWNVLLKNELGEQRYISKKPLLFSCRDTFYLERFMPIGPNIDPQFMDAFSIACQQMQSLQGKDSPLDVKSPMAAYVKSPFSYPQQTTRFSSPYITPL